MRTITTIILRLLDQGDDVRGLRGSLQTLDDARPRPFNSDQELLALLQQAVTNAPVPKNAPQEKNV